MLYGAKQKHWDVYGVEISQKAAEIGKKQYEIDIFIGSLLEANFESDFFDAVSMFDVIEHLPDPKSYIKEIFRILRPGGILYLDTPNFNSINRFIFKENWSVFFPKNIKKTKFCQMIENAIANSSIAGRPPNSDFLIGFWPGENCFF